MSYNRTREMLLEITDFNNADQVLSGELAAPWQQLHQVLEEMPLHLKASDQAGIQGTPIFDPVGTNEFIKNRLANIAEWKLNVAIPAQYDFLGTDVDFVSSGLLVEAQFSNYPFLLNNLLRSELFVNAKVVLGSSIVRAVTIVTKAHLFPASNSTLYYEQAHRQLGALSAAKVFDIPIRLIGLTAEVDTNVAASWTDYSAARYSRTVLSRGTRNFRIGRPHTARGRAVLTPLP